MHISYEWLKEFIDTSDAPEDLARKLTQIGFALESLDPAGKDFVFDFDIPTNRPDCLSHLGMAREASVIYGSKLRRPRFELEEGGKPVSQVFSISISDPQLCARYCGRYIAGVRIRPSPDWLKNRLEALGVRPINNVADATNLVMLELGQPLHAFDADKLQGQQIIVRRAAEEEKLTTLDGTERKLTPTMLVIADAKRPVALAGIMGGAETEISSETANVLLESASFDAGSIRRTSRATGLTTEASYRFERGCDVEMARYACDRTAALIKELAGGTIYRGITDVYPRKLKPRTVKLRRRRIEDFLGATVDDSLVERIFQRLEFKTLRPTEGWSVEVPAHRVDIAREEDLLEEIARHYGYDKFPLTLPSWSGFGASLPGENEERRLRQSLSSTGYTEICTYTFSDEESERRFRPDALPLKLQNPMTDDGTILRTSLLPKVLDAIQWNLNRGSRDLQFYELSKVYNASTEYRTLVLAATGAVRPTTVHEPSRDFDFFDLKGDVEEILQTFNAPLEIALDNIPAYYHSGRAARFGGLATFGELHPDYAEALKGRQRVYIAEVDIQALQDLKSGRQVQQVFRYPAVRRDFSLLLDKETPYGAVHKTILAAGILELVRVEPFDRLESGPFPDTKYSLSVSVVYRSAERTLTDSEVEGFDKAIIEMLEERLAAQLRR